MFRWKYMLHGKKLEKNKYIYIYIYIYIYRAAQIEENKYEIKW